MDISSKARMADTHVGTTVPAEAFKAFFAESASRNPGLARQMREFMSANGVDRGQPIRVRADYKYSRVGVIFSGAGGVIQANDPPALYSIGIGGPDPVLGTLDKTDTNVLQGGKQDSSELFKAYKHGFTLDIISNPAAAIADTIANTARSLLANTSAILNTGTQTAVEWPPLRALPGIITAFSTGGATSVGAGAPQGNAMLMPLNPTIDLGAGESYRVELLIKRTIAGGPTIVADATLLNSVWAFSHVFYGQSFTGIAG